jgi:hypothetical protein
MLNHGSSEKLFVYPNPYELMIHDPNPSPETPAPESSVPIADTLGWDTVFALHLPNVNHALAQPGASPGSFEQDLGKGYSIQGEFGPWQITRGGDGKNLYLLAPITSGSMEFNNVKTSMAGAEATVIITLDFTPTQPPPPPPGKDGSNHKLQVNTQSGGPSEPVASVIYLDFPQGGGPKPYTVPNALMMGALTQWFVENMATFEHVFSTIDLNLLADKASLQWLQPTNTSYAYADGKTDATSTFGVLTMTGKRSMANLSQEISPDAIPEGQQSGFLISSELFLKKSVLPGLPYAFKKATQSDFQLVENGTEVVKAPGVTVELKSIKYKDLSYQPYLESLSVQVLDTEIVSTLQVKIEVSPGIEVYIDITNYQTLELVQKSDGTQTLGYRQTRPMKHTYTKKVAPGVTIAVVLLELVVALVGFIILGPVGELVDLILIAIITVIIIGVIEGVELTIEDVVTKGVAEAMPPFNPLVYAATDPITWPTQKSRFTLASVCLNGAVQLGGTLEFAT